MARSVRQRRDDLTPAHATPTGSIPPKGKPSQSLPRVVSPYLPNLRPIADDPAENADLDTNPEPRRTHWQEIPDLRRQIGQLGAQIDAFKAERDTLSGILARERQVSYVAVTQ